VLGELEGAVLGEAPGAVLGGVVVREPTIEGWRASIDVMLMIRPPRPCSIVSREACFVQRKRPRRLTAMTRSKSAALIWEIGTFGKMPALLTRMSTVPKADRQAVVIAMTRSSSETSTANGSARQPRPLSSAAALAAAS
jgi:hypothetical protein